MDCFISVTLGYDRKLPGFPRYTVLGSDESGEYSLKVSNATLEDDAVYECQVGPAPSNRPIRASAKLNVMRKFFELRNIYSLWDIILLIDMLTDNN